MLILNGLRIGTDAGDGATDVRWRIRRVAALPEEPAADNPIAIVREVPTATGLATDHVFGYDGRVRCIFRIDADGSDVDCQAVPEVSDRDLFSLFAEPVMRTILFRRGILSFHAAALAKDGRAVAIMADKGAGKSSLSYALQQQGWALLADDLSRVEHMDGEWRVFVGHRQTKLTPAAARAFGHAFGELPPRFDDPGPPASAAQFDKRVTDPAEGSAEPLRAVPLAAIFALTARQPGIAAARFDLHPAPAAVRRLFEHLTPHPCGDGQAASPDLQRAVGRLASQVDTYALTLPDDFTLLAAGASALEARV